jgi:YhcH/YjgK/YiaL family protein
MMKFQNLQDLTDYLAIPQDAFDFVLHMTADTPDGRYDFGADCYVNVMHCDTAAEAAPMEAHEKFIDVQMVIAGEEKIFVAEKNLLALVTPYDEAKDIAFYAWENAEAVTYRSGEAVVLYPAEAHLPGRAAHEPMTIKKAVLKLKA